ncbi:MAG: cysteine desulfurase [Bacteroidales bacterium]|nr:cysteine desulfurase [Bacteroidales bacterium]
MEIEHIRNQFPILDEKVHGRPLVYLDNAATTQKPLRVIEAVSGYYKTLNANIHRGAHHLAAVATERYEAVRRQVQQLIGARHSHEIVFTRGTTEGINLVASSFARRYFSGDGDEVIVSGMEHHSNIVPWQLAGARLRPIPFSDSGVLDLEAYGHLFSDKTRLVAVNHVSNTLGTVNPVRQMVDIAHAHGVPVLVDGAQAISHLAVDVQALGCDFYCFSGHKMYAPMGVGVMYGREELLDQMPPYQGGGEMISEVTFERTTYNQLPFKFEAGTPSVGDVIGLGEAIAFMQEVGLDAIAAHEEALLRHATDALLQLPGIRLFGTAPQKTSVLSFLIGDAHPYDVGTLLDQLGIAVRTGHHCTQPVMDRYGIPGTVRASFALYNTPAEVDTFATALEKVSAMLM